jgi:hypothetical protein
LKNRLCVVPRIAGFGSAPTLDKMISTAAPSLASPSLSHKG